jgi:chemotaxis signal transduction protein
MQEREVTDATGPPRDEREALMMRLGGLAFAVYADECEGVTSWAEPAPLPHAPASILGIVSVRGRMRTLIDAARLFESLGLSFGRRPAEAECQIASLRGDEQLALAFEMGGPVPLTPDYLSPPPESPALPVLATFSRYGETVYLLDPARLFEAAMSGTERRRQRAVRREP